MKVSTGLPASRLIKLPEPYLKALFFSSTGLHPYTHDLSELIEKFISTEYFRLLREYIAC